MPVSLVPSLRQPGRRCGLARHADVHSAESINGNVTLVNRCRRGHHAYVGVGILHDLARLAAAPVQGRSPMGSSHPLDRVERFIRDYVVLPTEHAYAVVALWCAHTHMTPHLSTTPRLAIYSPEYGCGKSRLLEVLELLCHCPELLSNASPAYVFRRVHADEHPPTLLLDEADAIWSGMASDTHQELRGLINSGYRVGSTVGRVTGPQRDKVENFRTFAPVAIAGRGRDSIPESVATRSIHVPMRKRAPGEKLVPWNYRITTPRGCDLREALAQWSQCVGDQVGKAIPILPGEVVDRDLEVWEPLAIIADVAGGDWPHRVRDAAVTAVLDRQPDPEEMPLARRLLADMRTVFGGDDRQSTAELLERLNSLPDAPWSMRGNGNGTNAYALGRMLREYNIRPTDIRFGSVIRKGYEREHFADAWSSYLPAYVGESATSATSATSLPVRTVSAPSAESVADVALVADWEG